MSTGDALLAEFLHQYPFQPATGYWRAVEVGHVLEFPFPEGEGLDLGCGDGKLTRIVADRVGPRRWTGVDIDAQETSLAEGSGLYQKVHTVAGDHIPEQDARFDFAFSNSVLEHVPALSATLREVGRVLKPGGRFLFTVPSEHFHACLRGPLRPGEDRARYLGELDVRLAHLRYLTPEQWGQELAAAGMQVERVTRYFTRAQVRRWETISRSTAGVLFALYRGRKHPIEIQRSLGMRREGLQLPRPLARGVGRFVSLGTPPEALPPQGIAPEDTGCLAILARRA